MKKLTGFSLLCMMLCARVFATLTFFPPHMENGLAYAIGTVLSTALQLLLIIPAVKLAELVPEGPCAAAMGISKPLGVGVTICFLIYFLYEAFFDAGSMAYFTDYFFSVNMPRVITALCCTLTAIGLARLETAVIGRTAQAAFFGMAALLAVMAICSASELDLTRLDMALEDPSQVIGKAILSETERCECLVLFTFLAGRTESSPWKTARRFLAAKGVLVGSIFLMVTAVLGAFALHSKLPVFTLATFSENLITQRSDAVFLLVWVFMGIVKLGLLIHCAGECLQILFPKLSGLDSSAAAGIIPCLAAMPLLLSYRWERIVYSEQGLTGVVLLSFLLPLLLLSIINKRSTLKGYINGDLRRQQPS